MFIVHVLVIGLSMCVTGVSLAAETTAPATLTLKEKTMLPESSPLRNVFYVQPSGIEMMTYYTRSTDNGRSWTSQKPSPGFSDNLPDNYRRSPHPGFIDPTNGWMLAVVYAMDRTDVDRAVHEPKETTTDSYIRYSVSIDGGRTFLFNEPVIQEGDFDFKHPLEGLYLGKNAIFLGDMGCRPIRTQEGNIIIPTQMTILNDQGSLETFGSGWDYYQCLMLIGTWKQDHRLSWRVSEPIQADPSRTVRGLYEPTLAALPDGRILCVMRGSNGLKKDPNYELPSHKWFSVSTDGGFHWSTPEPWHYSNGNSFYSPASMSQIIPHSSGRFLWIGNISPANCQGNAPRWPIVIGEIDPQSMMLIQDSVITIDTRGPDEPEGLQLSNFYAFEDRENGDIVIPTQRWKPGDIIEQVIYRIACQ